MRSQVSGCAPITVHMASTQHSDGVGGGATMHPQNPNSVLSICDVHLEVEETGMFLECCVVDGSRQGSHTWVGTWVQNEGAPTDGDSFWMGKGSLDLRVWPSPVHLGWDKLLGHLSVGEDERTKSLFHHELQKLFLPSRGNMGQFIQPHSYCKPLSLGFLLLSG